MTHFPRIRLAREMIAALSGRTSLGDGPNGMFLAAPRRTGKTMFLKHDLMPQLTADGVIPIYVDLWEHRSEDPGVLIAAVIGRAARAHRSLLQKARDAVQTKKVNFGPVELEFDETKIGKVDGVSIADALIRLNTATEKPICLIVDEAQHALTSEGGINTMAALKSARDQMNRPGEVRLMLVMSGSDRDKLLRLVNSNAAPFYGSNITRMPTLDRDYTDALAREINTLHEKARPVDCDALWKAFGLYGARPQFLSNCVLAALDATSPSRPFNQVVLEIASTDADANNEDMQAVYLGLTDVQRAIVSRMLTAGGSFRPFDAKSMKYYAETIGREISVATAQSALDALRNREDPIVWRSARGEYSIEDPNMVRWFTACRDEGKWPPR